MNFNISHDPRWCLSLAVWANEKYSPGFTNAEKILLNLSKLDNLGTEDWQRNVDLIAEAIKPSMLQGTVQINLMNIKIINSDLVLVMDIILEDKACYHCAFDLTHNLNLNAVRAAERSKSSNMNKPSVKFELVELGRLSRPSFLFECAPRQNDVAETEDEESSDTLEEEDEGVSDKAQEDTCVVQDENTADPCKSSNARMAFN